MSLAKFFSGAIVAALAIGAQAQTFSNSTSTSSSASPSGTSAPSPLTVNGKTWAYEGCASDSLTNFAGFTQVETSPLMTIEKCLADCNAYEYAGINGPRCFCSNASDNSTVFVATSSCNYSCRGNPSEQCGGSSTGAPQPISKRQVTAGMLLTFYVAQAPAAVSSSAAPTITGSIIPSAVYTTVFETEYVSVCPTGLTTVPYSETLTLTHCGCTDKTPEATVAMTTSVGSCGCGPNGAQQTYTVTVPQALVSTTGSGSGSAASSGASIVTVQPCTTTVISVAPSSSTTVTLAPSGSACNACKTSVIGGQTVTLATPGSAVATGGSNGNQTMFTGAASHNGVAAGVMGAVALAAAML